MKASKWLVYGFALSAVSMGLTACGGGDEGTGELPQGAGKVQAWIDKGDYKSWHCETEKHAARSPSPHAYNRICSNNIISTNTEGTEYPYPKGSAAVKELWGEKGTGIVGYAYYLKLQNDSADGKGWYYYENNPVIKKDGAVADGVGDSGTANTVCVACHKAAGMDAGHSGHDYVYTQVK